MAGPDGAAVGDSLVFDDERGATGYGGVVEVEFLDSSVVDADGGGDGFGSVEFAGPVGFEVGQVEDASAGA
jgi:hypothetical protein